MVVANGMELPFKPESFDVVILSDVLTYRVIPNSEIATQHNYAYMTAPNIEAEKINQIKLLNECLRVIKPEGRLIIADAYATLLKSPHQASLQYLKSHPDLDFKLVSYQSYERGPASVYEFTKKPAN